MTNPAVDIAAGVAKLQAVLNLVPQINGIVLTSLSQVNQVLAANGVAPTAANAAASLTAVNKQIADTIALVGDIGVELNALIGVFGNFASSVQAIVEQAKSIGHTP